MSPEFKHKDLKDLKDLVGQLIFTRKARKGVRESWVPGFGGPNGHGAGPRSLADCIQGYLAHKKTHPILTKGPKGPGETSTCVW